MLRNSAAFPVVEDRLAGWKWHGDAGCWLLTLLHAPFLPTWPYITLPWLYFTLLDSKLLYHGSISLYTWFYTILLFDCTSLYCGSSSLHLTLHYSTMVLLHSIRLYITRPWLYFTLLDSTLLYRCFDPTSLYTWIYITLLYSSTSLHLTLHYSTIDVLHSTWLYITLPWLFLNLYIIV